ncbi:MAG: hypothetical protein JNK05_24435 [Myxococcales bacterium]|nr:hypothetical protein [Myxococcales bacterium]
MSSTTPTRSEPRQRSIASPLARDDGRERKARAWVVVALVLVAALPIAHRFLPLVDWPQHLAQGAIVAHETDDAFATNRYYRTTGWFIPYQGFRWLHVGASRVVGDDLLGGRVALSISLVLLALSILAITRALDRSYSSALVGFTLLVEANLLWGFAPYVLATALQLAQLAVALRWLRAVQRGDVRRSAATLVAIALLGVATFFSHAQPAMLGVVSLLALAVVSWARRRIDRGAAAKLCVALAPAGALIVLYLVAGGWLSGQVLEDEFRVRPQTVWSPPWASLYWLPLSSGLDSLGNWPWRLFVLASLASFVGAPATEVPKASRDEARLDPRAWSVEARLIAAVFCGAYMLLPNEFRGQSVAPRVASLALLSLAWLPSWGDVDPREDAHRRWVLRATWSRRAVAFSAIASLLVAHFAFARFDRSVRAIDRAIDALPRGSRVATLSYETHAEGLRLPVLLHLGAYTLVRRGGMNSTGFTRTGVTYREGVPRSSLTVMQLWAPSKSGWQLDPEQHAARYDAVFVVRGARYPSAPFRETSAGAVPPAWRRVYQDQRFELWRRFAP